MFYFFTYSAFIGFIQNLKCMKALLIDDNEEMTDLLRTYLELKGRISCTVTNSGKDGLHKILNDSHDVILLDMAMAGFSGFDVIKALEQRGKLRDHKIIVLTASSITDEDLSAILARGVAACVKKPVDLSYLLDVVRSYSKTPN